MNTDRPCFGHACALLSSGTTVHPLESPELSPTFLPENKRLNQMLLKSHFTIDSITKRKLSV